MKKSKNSRLKILKIALIPVSGYIILFFLIPALLPFPELEDYKTRSYGTVVEDRNGITLRVIPPEDGVKREWTSLDQIPAGVRRVFIKAEDRRFYFHPGVDLFSVAGSALRNITAGKTVSGASTITMQLARIIKPHSRGMAGKVTEAWDALRLEAKLSKNEILELWFNGIPFGSNIEGLGAMARNRFGLPVNQLDDVQAAVLAVVPRRPALYDPLYDESNSLRAALDLSERCRLNFDEGTLRAVILETRNVPAEDSTPFYAPHFTGRAVQEIRSSTEESPRIIKSTLDLPVQQFAEQQLRNELFQLMRNRVGNGAVLVIENDTGNVLVYAGSKSWFDDESQGKIDGVRVMNQPGSCLKPFLYAMALDSGFGPNEILPDLPTVFGGSEAYIPSNFDRRFNGPVRMRIALASSLNIPAVYTIERLGVARFEEYLGRLGFSSVASNAGIHGTGLALGNAEVSLEELVCAFAAFPRGGIPARLRFDYLQDDSAGQKNVADDQVISAQASWVISDILSDPASRYLGFGPALVFQLPFPAMFKTGTANQFQHIWALGATRQYTVGVWMGNFSGETVVGRTGSSIPARIASNILKRLETGSGEGAPKPGVMIKQGHVGGPVPAGLVQRSICSLSGMLLTDSCTGKTEEWMASEDIPGPCTWHRGTSVVYPPEYQAWIVERFRSAGTEQSEYAGIRIPSRGSVFFIDPSFPDSAQAVRIETYGFAPGTEVFVSGMAAGKINSAGVFMLPLSRGRHTIQIEDGQGNYAETEFEVR